MPKIKIRARLTQDWDCEFWQAAMPTATVEEKKDLPHKKWGIEISAKDSEDGRLFFKRAIDTLKSYKIYPSHKIEAFLCGGRETLQEGTTIIHRFMFGPLVWEAGVKILEVFDELTSEGHTSGFSYVTLAGHPARGIRRFSVRRKSGRSYIRIKIDSWVKPGHWFTAAFWPFIWLSMRKADEKALDFIADSIKKV